MSWAVTAFNETRRFLNRERKYAWMLIFIILFYALSLGIPKAPDQKGQTFVEVEEKLKEQALEGHDLYEKIWEQKRYLIYILGFAFLGAGGAFFIGAILLLFFLIVWLRGKDPTGNPIIVQEKPAWDIFDVVRVFILFLFISGVFVVFQRIFASAFNLEDVDKYLRQVVSTSVIDFLWLGLVLYFVLGKYGKKLSSIGLTLKGWLRGVIIGVIGYLSILPALLLVLIVVLVLSGIFKYRPTPEPIFELFYQPERAHLVFYFTCFVTFAGPIIEEIFFRGFAYPAVKSITGKNWAIFLSAVVFALLHANLLGFLPIMLLGAFLAYLYEKTGSLVPAITVHVLHNGAIMFIVFMTREVTQIQ